MKPLEELNCRMEYKRNVVFDAWNGCLVKNDTKDPGTVKVFVRNTKEECLSAATQWANNFPRQLKHPKPEGEIITFKNREEGVQSIINLCNNQKQSSAIEYALWLKENHTYVIDGNLPWIFVTHVISEAIHSLSAANASISNEYVIGETTINNKIEPLILRIPLSLKISSPSPQEIKCFIGSQECSPLDLFREEGTSKDVYSSLSGHDGRNLWILLKQEVFTQEQDYYEKFTNRVAIINHVNNCLSIQTPDAAIASFLNEHQCASTPIKQG